MALGASQVHKSLGDQRAGEALFNKYSEVPPQMQKIREIVMARKEPRKLLVQPVRTPHSASSSTRPLSHACARRTNLLLIR